MSTIKSSAENLTLNADGANNDIKFQSNGSEVASIDQAGVLVSAGGSTHADNVKAKFGTGDDLEIYHDGSHSYVKDNGTGMLIVDTNGDRVRIQAAGTEELANFNKDGSVELFYDNASKLATTATGIAVTGGVAIGGTGTANTLDDYEEGTFTATLTGHTSDPSTAVTETAYYTKVGNVVQIAISFNNRDTSGAVGNVQVTGLPFTSKSGEPRYPLSALFYNRFAWATDRTAYMMIPAGGAYMYAYAIKGETTWVQVTHSAGTGMHLWISGTYIAA